MGVPQDNSKNEINNYNTIDFEYTDNIKNIFINMYKKMNDENVRLEYFNKIFEILRSEQIFVNENLLIEDYKRNITEELVDTFLKMWEYTEIPSSLSILKDLKEKAVFVDTKQWRPTGKSPSEQTMPYRLKVLKGKIQYIEKHSNNILEEDLSNVIVELEQQRDHIEQMLTKMRYLSHQMDLRMKIYEQRDNKLQEFKLKVNNLMAGKDNVY